MVARYPARQAQYVFEPMAAQAVVGLQILFGGLGLQVPQVAGARASRGDSGDVKGEETATEAKREKSEKW